MVCASVCSEFIDDAIFDLQIKSESNIGIINIGAGNISTNSKYDHLHF